MYSHNHCTLIIDADERGLTVTVTSLRGLSTPDTPDDTDTWYVVVVVRFGDGLKVWLIRSAVPPVAAEYHLKTGLVTDVAVADSVTASPLHISVLLLVTVIISAEPVTVICRLAV